MALQNDWRAIEDLAIARFHKEIVTKFLSDVNDEIMEEKWFLPGEGPDHTTRRKNQLEYPGLTSSPRNLDDTHKLRDNVTVSAPGRQVSVDFTAGHAMVVHDRADFTINPIDKFMTRSVQM